MLKANLERSWDAKDRASRGSRTTKTYLPNLLFQGGISDEKEILDDVCYSAGFSITGTNVGFR